MGSSGDYPPAAGRSRTQLNPPTRHLILDGPLRMTIRFRLLAYRYGSQWDASDRGDRQPLDAGLRADDTRRIPKDDLHRVLKNQTLCLDVEIGANILVGFGFSLGVERVDLGVLEAESVEGGRGGEEG